MAITREQVLHVAALAQLGLSEEEVTRFSKVSCRRSSSRWARSPSSTSTGIEPTSHPLDIVNVFGEDVPEPCLTLEDALANAPDPEDGSFGVPAP